MDRGIERKYKSSWSDSEFILTLDLYFNTESSEHNIRNQKIIEVARLIGRTPDSVCYRLGNYVAIDPDIKAKGFDNRSKKVATFFERYKNQKIYLHALAEQIIIMMKSGTTLDIGLDLYDEDISFPEGKILLRLHKSRERNKSLVNRKKKTVLNKEGKLACEVCNFDYSKAYGEIGQGFIECHHIIPLAELSSTKKTKLKDLALVCANCHRMLHRGSNLTIVNLKKQLINNIVY